MLNKYRLLKEGEIIQEGDEFDTGFGNDPDKGDWQQTTLIGESAPSPEYAPHRAYRRLI